jgi:hypothetical protein
MLRFEWCFSFRGAILCTAEKKMLMSWGYILDLCASSIGAISESCKCSDLPADTYGATAATPEARATRERAVLKKYVYTYIDTTFCGARMVVSTEKTRMAGELAEDTRILKRFLQRCRSKTRRRGSQGWGPEIRTGERTTVWGIDEERFEIVFRTRRQSDERREFHSLLLNFFFLRTVYPWARRERFVLKGLDQSNSCYSEVGTVGSWNLEVSSLGSNEHWTTVMNERSFGIVTYIIPDYPEFIVQVLWTGAFRSPSVWRALFECLSFLNVYPYKKSTGHLILWWFFLLFACFAPKKGEKKRQTSALPGNFRPFPDSGHLGQKLTLNIDPDS